MKGRETSGREWKTRRLFCRVLNLVPLQLHHCCVRCLWHATCLPGARSPMPRSMPLRPGCHPSALLRHPGLWHTLRHVHIPRSLPNLVVRLDCTADPFVSPHAGTPPPLTPPGAPGATRAMAVPPVPADLEAAAAAREAEEDAARQPVPLLPKALQPGVPPLHARSLNAHGSHGSGVNRMVLEAGIGWTQSI